MTTQQNDYLIPNNAITTFQSTKQNPFEDIIKNVPSYVLMEQCHGADITLLTDPNNIPKLVPSTDALITTIPELTIVVKTADCLPILIYHPYPAVAAIHAGRKGTELGIFKKTLEVLQSQFGIADSLSIWFGPHITEKNYEINAETKEHYNLFIKNKTQLLQAVKRHAFQFFDSKKCTVDHNNEFFSYRKEKTTLRNYSGIQIKNLIK